jgi:hypothetical protein
VRASDAADQEQAVILAAFFVGLVLGLVVGMVIEWTASLPREFKR